MLRSQPGMKQKISIRYRSPENHRAAFHDAIYKKTPTGLIERL
jgi:hypothetical protein